MLCCAVSLHVVLRCGMLSCVASLRYVVLWHDLLSSVVSIRVVLCCVVACLLCVALSRVAL